MCVLRAIHHPVAPGQTPTAAAVGSLQNRSEGAAGPWPRAKRR